MHKVVAVSVATVMLTVAQQGVARCPAALPTQQLTNTETQIEFTPYVFNTKQTSYQILKELQRGGEYHCMYNIFEKESSWNPDAVGDNGDSIGLPQRHVPSHGYPDDGWGVREQVEWTIWYADSRYGGLCKAWSEWQRKGWW